MCSVFPLFNITQPYQKKKDFTFIKTYFSMIILRTLPAVIKVNHLIKLTTISKTQLLKPCRLSVINHCPGAFQVLHIKGMSTDMDKELNDPQRHLDYNQLIARKDKQDVIIIDVREHSEINETGKIPGSIHIPLAELKKALSEMLPEDFKKQYSADKPLKDKEIIFSCKAGGRSLKALKLGLELGYNAKNYKGGWLDWAEKSKLQK